MQADMVIQNNIHMTNTMMHDRIVLSARGITKSFGGQLVLEDISLDLKEGEVVLLRGENGSGKTTLLNILTGNIEPDRGELHLSIYGCREVFKFSKAWYKELNPFDHFTPERLAWEGVGRVWQDIRLFPTMTTLENVMVATPKQRGDNPFFALIPGYTKKEDKLNLNSASTLLTRLGLDKMLDSSCDKISLGQMKRVAIARALQAGAKILFLDEPLSGLDKKGVSDVMMYLELLAREKAITLVIVEHIYNIPTILKLADTIWTLSKGKLSAIEVDAFSQHNNDENISVFNIIKELCVDTSLVKIEELPNGARLTTASSSQQSEAVLEVRDLVIKKGIRIVLEGLSLSINKGQIAILEAPNGWGKSSLLDVISGIHPAESGKIVMYTEDISLMPTHKRIKRGLAYLRSQTAVFNSLTVKEHWRLSNKSSPLFTDSLNKDSKGSVLSGGQKQRLLIDILPDAKVYLLDEPLIGLDKEGIESIKCLIKQLVNEGKTVLITVPVMSEQ